MRNVSSISIRDVRGGAVLAVKVVPGASRDRVVGVLGDCLKVATTAPPERGRANAAVAGILAGALGAALRDLSLRAGAGRAQKEFFVAGVSAAELRRRLAEL